MYVFVKRRKFGQQVFLAICDEDIIGKTFRGSDIVFEIKQEFYKGFKTTLEDSMKLIHESSVINLVGCNTVKKAIEKGFVHPEAVINISGVLHAQILKI